MKQIGIYLITHIPTGRCYVGSSKDCQKRLINHRYFLNRGTHFNIHLQSAWNLYGSEQFLFEFYSVIEEEARLEECEQYYMDKFDSLLNGFNQKDAKAKGGRRIEFSEETRRKISEGNKGKKHTEESKRLISVGNKGKSKNLGRKASGETKQKMSDAHKARIRPPKKPLTQEHKDAIRAGMLARRKF